MEHFEYELLISCLLDGEITPQEKEKLDAHLSRCPECAALLEELRADGEELRALSPEPPKALLEGVMREIVPEKQEKKKAKILSFRYIAAAAAAVAVIICAAAVLPMLRNRDSDKSSATPEAYYMSTATSGASGAARKAAAEDAPMNMAASGGVSYAGDMATDSAGASLYAAMAEPEAAADNMEAAGVGSVSAVTGGTSAEEAKPAAASESGTDSVSSASSTESTPGASQRDVKEEPDIPDTGARRFRIYIFMSPSDGLPEGAERLEGFGGDAEKYFVVPLDTARELESRGFEAVLSEDGEDAGLIVIR